MTERADNQELLPPGSGARPWLPSEPVEVPVTVVDGRKIGTAQVYAGADGSLMADVTFGPGVKMSDYVLSFGVDGRIAEEHVVDGVRSIDRVELRSVVVAAIPAEERA